MGRLSLAGGSIQASCKNILLSTDMLDNAHLYQPVQPGTHFFSERPLVIQRINHQKIFR